MPLYEYKCKDCGEVFGILQTMDADKSGVECKKCKSNNTERIISCFAQSSGSSDMPSCTSGSCCSCNLDG